MTLENPILKRIQVLGADCPKCRKMAENAEAAAQALGIEYTFEKIRDIDAIMDFGVRAPPALVVDGQVKIAGRAAGIEEIKKFLS